MFMIQSIKDVISNYKKFLITKTTCSTRSMFLLQQTKYKENSTVHSICVKKMK